MRRIKGAYSLVLTSPTKLIAARDPHGFRPLCMGALPEGGTVFASESCALDAVGAAFVRDIAPGEVVVADRGGVRSLSLNEPCASSLCVFEFIYFARPDSVIDGSAVHTARLRAGAFLALEHPVQADVVVGVPDSGIDAAIGYVRQSGIPYGVGFIKNKYVGRTFIQPGQAARQDAVRIKLAVVDATVKGKRVVLIDDSIVRGTTSARIVSLLREAGAKEVHMRLSSPRSPSLLLWHRYRLHRPPDRRPPQRGGDSRADRRGQPGLPARGMSGQASRPQFLRLLQGVLHRAYPVDPPAEAAKNKFETFLSLAETEKEGCL
jgi:amidophosphoribosyltransferase